MVYYQMGYVTKVSASIKHGKEAISITNKQ